MAKKKVEDSQISSFINEGGKKLEEKLNNALIPVDKQPYKIPQNWCWVKIMNIGEVVTGRTPNTKEKSYFGGNVPFIKPADIDQGRYIIFSKDTLSEEGKNVSRPVPKGSTCICCIGTIGKCGYLMVDAVTNQQINTIIPYKIVNSLFVYYYCISDYFQHTIINNSYATTIFIIKKSKMASLPFPLPPLAEQERIVNKLDNYISKLDEAKEKLEKVVDTYEFRKSVILHKAFTGELTKKWRKENKISFGNWNKNKLSDLCIINPPKNIQNVSENTIVSVIPMSCVSEDGYVIEYLTKEIKDVQKGLTNFIEGDVVFAKITPCMENGKSAIIGKLANDIGFGTTEFYVFRCNDKLYNKYLHYIFRDKVFRINAKYYMRGSVGQQRLPKSYLENYILNLPPIEEQKEIVKLLDSILSKEKQVKEIAEKEIERVEDLKKNLLTRAFGGVLGTNDLSEENSIELLKSVL